MKAKITFLSLIFSLVVGNALAADDVNQAASATNQSQQNAQPNAQANAAQPNAPQQTTQANQAANKDGEIVAFLIVLNKNEIAASREALKRKIGPGLRTYARMLNQDHSKGLQAALKLSKSTGIQPVDTETTNALKDKGQQDLNNLKSLNNQQFRTAFLDAMVAGHEAALNKIDESIQTASNPQLKAQLEKVRVRVNTHLQKAKLLQDKLKANA